MRIKLKMAKFQDYLNDGKRHMYEISVDNQTCEFKAFDVTNIDGVKAFLDDINAAKQSLEDYLCEHE